jgi:(p)ppGpp synthase/HD superfamily hydrolase
MKRYGRITEIKAILKKYPDRKSFFRLIAAIYPTLDPKYLLIRKAYDDAKDAFRGVKRQGGERYFEHLRAVALILIVYMRVTDYRIIVAALLHDIFEDVPSWTIERIRREYGDEIAYFVECLSKPNRIFKSKEECEYVYERRLKAARRGVILIKMPDRLHNLITLWSCSAEKRARKVAETKRFYLPLAEKHFLLYHEIRDALEMLEAGCEKSKKRKRKKKK